jgi:hypothetical protein
MTKTRTSTALAVRPVMPAAGRKARSARKRLEAFDIVVRSLDRSLPSAEHVLPRLGNLRVSSPLHLLDQSLLTCDALLGFQYTSSCHVQGFVNGYQPPGNSCEAPRAAARLHWHTGLHQLQCRRRSTVRIYPMWAHRRSAHVRIVSARKLPLQRAILPYQWGGGIDLDQSPIAGA